MELAKLNKDFTQNTFVESAGNGDKLAVELFLAAGMDVNAKYEHGDRYVAGANALAIACSKGQTEVVNMLLAKGADVKVHVGSQSRSTTPLLAACEQGHRDIAIILLNHAESAVGLGFNDYTGSSAMKWAAKNGWTDVVKLLLLKGADYLATAPDSDFKTPLEYAKEGGHTEIVRLLEQVREREEKKLNSSGPETGR
jgi:ankyrin repeat protein